MEEKRKIAAMINEKKKLEAIRKEQRRQAILQKLRNIGICPAGFAWMQNDRGGFTCSAGGHSISFEDAGTSAAEVAEVFA